MNKYKPRLYDVITLLDFSHASELEDMGVSLKEEYMVSYIFVDGSIVIYREVEASKVSPGYAEEFVIEDEFVNSFNFLYSYLDNADVTIKYADSDVNDGFYEAFNLNNPSNYKAFEIGSFVYSEEIEKVSLSDIMELENFKEYKVHSYSGNGGMFITTKHGDFEIFPSELYLFKKCDEDFYDKELLDLEEMLDSMLEENVPNIIQNMIDSLLDSCYDGINLESKYKRIEELSNMLKLRELEKQLKEKRK